MLPFARRATLPEKSMWLQDGTCCHCWLDHRALQHRALSLLFWQFMGPKTRRSGYLLPASLSEQVSSRRTPKDCCLHRWRTDARGRISNNISGSRCAREQHATLDQEPRATAFVRNTCSEALSRHSPLLHIIACAKGSDPKRLRH